MTGKDHYKGLVYLVKTKGLNPDKIVLDKAALKGNIDSVKLMMDNGLVPDKKTLDSAFYSRNYELADLIIKNYDVKPDDRSVRASRLYKYYYYPMQSEVAREKEFIDRIVKEYNLKTPDAAQPSPHLSPEDQQLWDELFSNDIS